MLHEGFLSEVLDMVQVRQLAFVTLTADQQISLTPSSTLYLKWRIHVHRGERKEALKTAIKIHDLDGWMLCQGTQIYQGSNNLMALSYITTGDYSKALEWFWRVSDAWRANISVPQSTSRDSLPLPSVLKAQEGWACLLLNDIDSAKALLESALECITTEHHNDPEAMSTIEL